MYILMLDLSAFATDHSILHWLVLVQCLGGCLSEQTHEMYVHEAAVIGGGGGGALSHEESLQAAGYSLGAGATCMRVSDRHSAHRQPFVLVHLDLLRTPHACHAVGETAC